MKNISLLFALLMISFTYSNAQITIGNDVFPKPGDNLKYAESTDASLQLDMKGNAGPHEWDFEVLNKGRLFTERYVSPSEGTDTGTFSDADLLLFNGREERYFKSSDTQVEGLGFGGINPLFGAPIAIRYTKRPAIRFAPLKFIDTKTSEGAFKIGLPASVFPDTLLAIFPAGFVPDSVRIEFTSESTGLIDAFGTLKMQGQTFNVLREKVAETTQTKVGIKLALLGWVDLKTIASTFNFPLPEFLNNILGEQKRTIYKFHTDTKKEILVAATYEQDGTFQSVTFADLGGVTSGNTDVKGPEFTLYPNPASDHVTLATPEWNSGTYLITIADVNGRIVYAEPCELFQHSSKTINTDKINTGTYFLTIRDVFNRISGTTQFLIVK
ncbi:MAG: T9SS type A sorting domain-containing protein [Saprospiraceae bacterium]|nr:MAG: PKD domain-containing protein [Bacteroidetes bacterium OLB9]MCO6462869.1 T9SS type A sorting domain-containing protein [Saprospiraceae bacterium]MCZ2337976.1 T9SS type A sorting domain-containing protein [Chitinophagales bacterium]